MQDPRDASGPPAHPAPAAVRPQALSVGKAARASLKRQRPVILWLTGLSGAGKSTIADRIEERLWQAGYHTTLLDGDNLRGGLTRDLGFSDADRVENMRRVGETAKLMLEAGLIVICSFISPFRKERMLARALVDEGEFLEIFIDTPLAECMRRDPKGLYARAKAGLIPHFTGITSPYEAPVAPEIRLDTLGCGVEDAAGQVLAELRRRGVIA
ncbi:Adenylyl-sulfate kinase [Methylobacterium crusticola]|uniref:Adenylyl-sulfate kinase n=1 Tax=Methylobacterium crusticola TaxID=1697972 RepID=A0ABQ4R047_9HYPH|nr:Adenylyl-sulfate kinase [Methylobacterium crusticola]